MNTREEIEDVHVETLRALLEQGSPVRVLDIRDREDFSEWRIPGSRHLATEKADGDVRAAECPDLTDDRAAVVVCRRGNSSRAVARDLRERCGFNARSLHGGMAAWSFAWNAAVVPDPEERVGLVQLRRTGKGCLSYLAGAGGEAVVVDASLAPEVYLREAEARGWSITAVVDTHLHADHVSRARVLADAAVARLLHPAEERTGFEHETLEDGDSIDLGPVRLSALRTPGHTGESLSYLLDGRFLLSGDTLFLGSVGRPDLESSGGEKDLRRRARILYRSLTRLTELDDDVLVLPGHASGPVDFDREPLAAPLETVQKNIPLLALDEDKFVRAILERIPPTPPNHDQIVQINEAGEYPESELIELESGANRCAAS